MLGIFGLLSTAPGSTNNLLILQLVFHQRRHPAATPAALALHPMSALKRRQMAWPPKQRVALFIRSFGRRLFCAFRGFGICRSEVLDLLAEGVQLGLHKLGLNLGDVLYILRLA